MLLMMSILGKSPSIYTYIPYYFVLVGLWGIKNILKYKELKKINMKVNLTIQLMWIWSDVFTYLNFKFMLKPLNIYI